MGVLKFLHLVAFIPRGLLEAVPRHLCEFGHFYALFNTLGTAGGDFGVQIGMG